MNLINEGSKYTEEHLWKIEKAGIRLENKETYEYFRENVDQKHLKCLPQSKREMNKTKKFGC